MRGRDTVQALIVTSLFRHGQQHCAAYPRRFCSALPRNLYETLGVASTASKPVIKEAFRKVLNITQCQALVLLSCKAMSESA